MQQHASPETDPARSNRHRTGRRQGRPAGAARPAGTARAGGLRHRRRGARTPAAGAGRVRARLGGAVAVRSSALGEDSAEASFAGQFETVLGVEGAPAVREAVERCLASTAGARVEAYRNEMHAQGEVSMAVVVQRMVDAAAAGVIFTADPVTGQRDRIVINAVPGLGEALVGGRSSAGSLRALPRGHHSRAHVAGRARRRGRGEARAPAARGAEGRGGAGLSAGPRMGHRTGRSGLLAAGAAHHHARAAWAGRARRCGGSDLAAHQLQRRRVDARRDAAAELVRGRAVLYPGDERAVPARRGAEGSGGARADAS